MRSNFLLAAELGMLATAILLQRISNRRITYDPPALPHNLADLPLVHSSFGQDAIKN